MSSSIIIVPLGLFNDLVFSQHPNSYDSLAIFFNHFILALPIQVASMDGSLRGSGLKAHSPIIIPDQDEPDYTETEHEQGQESLEHEVPLCRNSACGHILMARQTLTQPSSPDNRQEAETSTTEGHSDDTHHSEQFNAAFPRAKRRCYQAPRQSESLDSTIDSQAFSFEYEGDAVMDAVIEKALWYSTTPLAQPKKGRDSDEFTQETPEQETPEERVCPQELTPEPASEEHTSGESESDASTMTMAELSGDEDFGGGEIVIDSDSDEEEEEIGFLMDDSSEDGYITGDYGSDGDLDGQI